MVKFVWNNNIAMCIGALIVVFLIAGGAWWYRKPSLPNKNVSLSSGPVNPFQNSPPQFSQENLNLPPNVHLAPSNIPPPSPPPPPPSQMEAQYGNTSLSH